MIYKCMLHSVLPFGKLLSSPVQSEILIGFFDLYVTGFKFYIPYRICEKSSMPGSIMVGS